MKTQMLIIAVLLCLLCACKTKGPEQLPKTTKEAGASVVAASVAAHRIVDSLAGIDKVDTVSFRARNGKLYTVASSAVDLLDTEPPEAGAGVHPMASSGKNKPCDGAHFDGKDRKAAKTTIDKAAVEDYSDLDTFMASLPPDIEMGNNHHPPIGTGSTSKRVHEEKRNVHVQSLWIYAFAREADEDYHVIVGTQPVRSQSKFLNAEISGLPNSSSTSFQKLKKVRSDFETFFGLVGSCISGYREFIDTPVKAEVKGSLFFDKLYFDQQATIGPPDARPKSYWEIHPVTDIAFE